MTTAQQKVAEDASQRYRETAKMANERLDKVRVTAAALPPAAQEALGSLQWVTCMLLNTAEDALKAKTALNKAHEQHAADQLDAATMQLEQAHQTMEAALAERDSVHKEMATLGKRIRKDGLTERQRQAKDAARIQALTEQTTQLQANIRLSESAWAEERRAEQAAAAQRERNFQQVIVKLQHELDALRHGEATNQQQAASASASADAAEVEGYALRARVTELQEQCDHGVALIERLKTRLQKSEKEKDVAEKREAALNSKLTGLTEQLRNSTAEASEHKETLKSVKMKMKEMKEAREAEEARKQKGGDRYKERYDAEVKLLKSELDDAQLKAKEADERARTSAVAALGAAHKLHAAEAACKAAVQAAEEAKAAAAARAAAAEARALEAEGQQQAATETSRRSSAGAVALLRAALAESQRKLDAVQRQLELTQRELTELRAQPPSVASALSAATRLPPQPAPPASSTSTSTATSSALTTALTDAQLMPPPPPRPPSATGSANSSSNGGGGSLQQAAAAAAQALLREPAAAAPLDADGVATAFSLIDANGDGVLSRAEVIKACRASERVRTLLGLPKTIRQEDGTRDAFEAVFQRLDVDDSKSITLDEFRHFFASRRPAQQPLQPLYPGQLLLEGGASYGDGAASYGGASYGGGSYGGAAPPPGASYGGGAALPTPFATPKVQFSGVTPNTMLRFGGTSAATTAAPTTEVATAAQQTPSSFPAGGDDAHSIRGLGRMRASLLDSLRAERSKLERERAMLGRM